MITKFVHFDELAKVTESADTKKLSPGDIVNLTGPEVGQIIGYEVMEVRSVKGIKNNRTEQHAVIKKLVKDETT